MLSGFGLKRAYHTRTKRESPRDPHLRPIRVYFFYKMSISWKVIHFMLTSRDDFQFLGNLSNPNPSDPIPVNPIQQLTVKWIRKLTMIEFTHWNAAQFFHAAPPQILMEDCRLLLDRLRSPVIQKSWRIATREYKKHSAQEAEQQSPSQSKKVSHSVFFFSSFMYFSVILWLLLIESYQ